MCPGALVGLDWIVVGWIRAGPRTEIGARICPRRVLLPLADFRGFVLPWHSNNICKYDVASGESKIKKKSSIEHRTVGREACSRLQQVFARQTGITNHVSQRPKKCEAKPARQTAVLAVQISDNEIGPNSYWSLLFEK